VGYDLTKRLNLLKDQSEAETQGRLSGLSVFIQTFLVLAFVAFFASQLRPSDELRFGGMNPEVAKKYSSWQRQTKFLVEERRDYLMDSFFGEFRAELYLQFSNNVMEMFGVSEPSSLSDKAKILDFESWGQWFSECLAGILLRACFVIFACFHLWILGLIGGYFAFKHLLIPARTTDFLGVLDRKRGPFYSGVYGPLRPNKSNSGTDLSCPSLACPKMAPKKQVIKHSLFLTLQKYGAVNETNVGLVQIILAYKDYPSIVDEERKIEDQDEDNLQLQPSDPNSTFVTNDEGTIESSSIELLKAVLSAHQAVKKEFGGVSGKDDYSIGRNKLISISTKLPGLAGRLVLALTPKRAEELAKIPATGVASTYLSIEAGKALLFKKQGEVFFQISKFPHLQARAVLQSLVSYHQEYSGDLRLTIRHAIISSRRHGDFGRAILPVNMSVASRALRDWLEILYSAPRKRDGYSNLVELDANLEELHLEFRKEFIKRLLAGGVTDRSKREVTHRLNTQIWKGIYYKSVVLIPLENLFDIVMSGSNEPRIERIGELLQMTRKLQSGLSISARLPGFKRQAEEAEKDAHESGGITRALNEDPRNKHLLDGWLIIRRMLIRYNWLSTRVGDSAVPVDGLIQAVVLDRTAGERPEVLGLDTLVPLRQRQFKELLGPKWEEQFYAVKPSSNDIDIYEEIHEFRDGLREIREQAAKGLFDKALQVNRG
jgi:hypothetical protein